MSGKKKTGRLFSFLPSTTGKNDYQLSYLTTRAKFLAKIYELRRTALLYYRV